MRRGDKKFASNTSLFCCSEHFIEDDYRKSLTCKRHDLIIMVIMVFVPHKIKLHIPCYTFLTIIHDKDMNKLIKRP